MDKYKNMTCLIADDFSTARRIIKNALQELGVPDVNTIKSHGMWINHTAAANLDSNQK